MFKNPFSFNGRIRRLEFGLSIAIFYAYYFAIILILQQIAITGLINFETEEEVFMILTALLVPGYWLVLAQGAKRCHDRGNSGWFQLIPFYGLWMLFADSEPGENNYGPNPKGVGNPEDEIDQIGQHLM